MDQREIIAAIEEGYLKLEKFVVKKAVEQSKIETGKQVNEIAEVFASQINIEFKVVTGELKDDISKLYIDNRRKILEIETNFKAKYEDHEKRILYLEERDLVFGWFARNGWRILAGTVGFLVLFVVYEYFKFK